MGKPPNAKDLLLLLLLTLVLSFWYPKVQPIRYQSDASGQKMSNPKIHVRSLTDLDVVGALDQL